MTEIFLRIRNTNPDMDDYIDRGPILGSIDAYIQFYSELAWALHPHGSVYRRHMPPPEPEMGGGGVEPEIVVTLLSGGLAGGILTALYQALHTYLTKDKDRELTLERDGKRITVRGHSLPEEKELIRELFPEALKDRPLTLDDH